MEVSGRTVLVTGASGGIGQAIARAFAERGAQVILTGRRVDVLEPLAQETRGRVIGVDLAERDGVDRLLEEAGDVDVLVANAALPASGRIDGYSVDQIDRALDVNLRAPIVMSRALGMQMAARGSGHIVLVSSLSGKAATPGSSLYSATKFGLRGFGLGLRHDLERDGVGVSIVFPGFIRDAGMFHESGAKLPPGVGTRTPEDVARAVVGAVERNRAEVDVAPVALRAGAMFAQVAPGLAQRANKASGAQKIADALESGQQSKR
jgi:short-subunit dehydrogenase